MVATISRIRDATTTLFINSPQIPIHEQHNNSKRKLLVNPTRVHTRKFTKYNAHISNFSNISFTTQAKVNIYNPKFSSSYNCHAINLLKFNTASAPQFHITKTKLNSPIKSDIKINLITMSAHESPQLSPCYSPQTPRVTFQAIQRPT